jgi:DNA-binding transcriptional LysR family regulator
VGSHLLPHALEALSINYPGINVEVNDGCHDYAEVPALMARGAADIGITREQADTQFISRPFVTDQYVAVVPSDAQLSAPLQWEHLLSLPFIHVQQPGASWIVDRCRSAGVDLQPARRTASEGAALSLVRRGLGFSLLPRLANFPKTPGTKEMDLPIVITRRLAVFAMPAHTQSSAVKAVLRSVLDRRHLEQTEAWRAGAIRLEI